LAEIEAGNGSSRVWHNLGNEHYRAGAYAEAARCYGVSLDIGGYPVGRFHGSFYKAACHLLLNQIDQAIAEVSERSIILGPSFAEAHCLLGDCLFLTDRFAEARQSYLNALTCKGKRPSNPLPKQSWMEEAHPTRQLNLIAGIV
jgi:tetratricopeptide (TPR) repeat protein